MFDYDDGRFARLSFKLMLVCIVLLFAYFWLFAEPPRQDAMDGTYANDGCPSFQIRNGIVSYEGGEITGKVRDTKIGMLLQMPKGLAFTFGTDGCRFELSKRYVKLIPEGRSSDGLPEGISLPSLDGSGDRFWVRTGPPSNAFGDAKKGADK